MSEDPSYELFCRLRQATLLALREWADSGADWTDIRQEIKATGSAMAQLFILSQPPQPPQPKE